MYLDIMIDLAGVLMGVDFMCSVKEVRDGSVIERYGLSYAISQSRPPGSPASFLLLPALCMRS